MNRRKPALYLPEYQATFGVRAHSHTRFRICPLGPPCFQRTRASTSRDCPLSHCVTRVLFIHPVTHGVQGVSLVPPYAHRSVLFFTLPLYFAMFSSMSDTSPPAAA